MEKEQFEILQSLVLEVFHAASAYVEKRSRDLEPDAVPMRLEQELIEDYPILRFKNDPEQAESLISVLVADGLLPPEEDQQEFFLHILDKIKGSNKSHAHHNATLALRVLSESYKSQCEISIEPN